MHNVHSTLDPHEHVHCIQTGRKRSSAGYTMCTASRLPEGTAVARVHCTAACPSNTQHGPTSDSHCCRQPSTSAPYRHPHHRDPPPLPPLPQVSAPPSPESPSPVEDSVWPALSPQPSIGEGQFPGALEIDESSSTSRSLPQQLGGVSPGLSRGGWLHGTTGNFSICQTAGCWCLPAGTPSGVPCS